MSDENRKLTQIGEIGEFGLIDRLTKKINLKNRSSVYGVGDDAAVLDYSNKLAVSAINVLNEGVHFNLVYFPLKHLGYKAIVSTISNVVAMNAIPRQVMIGISLSNRFSVEAIEEIYEGIHLACDKYQVDLIGGDTTSSLSGLSLSITAIGEGGGQRLVYRSGAKPNELICVTGNLGAAYLGLQLLEREKAIYEDNKNVQPDLTGYEYILARQLKPEINVGVLEKLQDKQIHLTSLTDVTDGLAADLLHLCDQSNTGCTIYQEKIPIDKETREAAEEFNLEPTTCALNGGDDFELLFTIPIDSFELVKDISNVSVIGHINPPDEGKKLITVNNEPVELIAAGWGNQNQETN